MLNLHLQGLERSLNSFATYCDYPTGYSLKFYINKAITKLEDILLGGYYVCDMCSSIWFTGTKVEWVGNLKRESLPIKLLTTGLKPIGFVTAHDIK